MNKEYFKILKEISSLEKEQDQLQYENSEETARVEKLRQRQADEETEKQNFLNDLQIVRAQSAKNENELSLASSKMQKIKADLAGSFDSKNIEKMEHQAETIASEIDRLENEGLELLEKSEALENEIKEKETFLAGISETIQEIKDEVDRVSGINQKQIDSLARRIEMSAKQLPENFVRAYEQVKSKGLSIGAFTSIDSGRCEVCKMNVDKRREKEVEEDLSVKTCSSCGRIFIPKASLY